MILQELRRYDGPGPDPLLEGLADGGLGEQVFSPVVGRENGILIASRCPFQATPLAQALGQPVHMLLRHRTFACTHLFQTLLQQGWVDAWRARHGKAREFSWISARSGHGFRYDHALVSAPLNPRVKEVRYLHHLLLGGLPDHSALVVEFGSLEASV